MRGEAGVIGSVPLSQPMLVGDVTMVGVRLWFLAQRRVFCAGHRPFRRWRDIAPIEWIAVQCEGVRPSRGLGQYGDNWPSWSKSPCGLTLSLWFLTV